MNIYQRFGREKKISSPEHQNQHVELKQRQKHLASVSCTFRQKPSLTALQKPDSFPMMLSAASCHQKQHYRWLVIFFACASTKLDREVLLNQDAGILSSPIWAPMHAPMKEALLQVHPPQLMVSLTAVSNCLAVRTPCSAAWNAPGKPHVLGNTAGISSCGGFDKFSFT